MTAIQWTDETWNPVTGCTRVSPGCDHCYASTLHNSRYRSNVKATLALSEGGSDPDISRRCGADWLPFPAQYDTPFAMVKTWEHVLEKPLTWRKPRRVFTCSMGDLFHEDVPFEFIDKVFAVMALADWHTFQVLTKRPERAREYLTTDNRVDAIGEAMEAMTGRPVSGDPPDDSFDYLDDLPLPNVWLGTSVEDQAAAVARIPELLSTPAAVRFLSCEPLLGPVDLLGSRYKLPGGGMGSAFNWGKGIDWVITGGESGKGARACDVGWIRSVRDQCRAAGVPVFVKQLGSVVVGSNDDGFEGDTGSAWPEGTRVTFTEGGFQGSPCLVNLRHSHGGDMEEWPEDLRVREFPNAE